MALNLKSLLRKTTLLHPSSLDLADKSCPVCLETYLQDASNEFPRRLPCGHVLGTECLLIWAADQASTKEGVKCPWCRKVVVNGVKGKKGHFEINAEGGDFGARDGEGVGGGEGVSGALEHWVIVLLTLLTGGVEHWVMTFLSLLGGRVVALALLFYHRHDEWPLALLEGFLLVLGLGGAVMVRIDKHPGYGAVLVVLGLCVGPWCGWWWLGTGLLELGKVPLGIKMAKAYEMHLWKMLAGAIALQWILAGAEGPGGRMMKLEAKIQMLGCVSFWAFDRLMSWA